MKAILWSNMIATAVEFTHAEMDDLSLSDQLCNTRMVRTNVIPKVNDI